jgi:hypothetical protein
MFHASGLQGAGVANVWPFLEKTTLTGWKRFRIQQWSHMICAVFTVDLEVVSEGTGLCDIIHWQVLGK